MLILCGLGNPGPTYDQTRHNVGFAFLNYLQTCLDCHGFCKRFSGELSLCKDQSHAPVLFFKPGLFMNNSGPPIGQLASFYKVQSSKIFVFYDDADLDFLKIKITNGGSDGGHNGIKSIDQHICKGYWKIRFGIGRDRKKNLADHVLSKFSEKEACYVDHSFKFFAQNIKNLMQDTEKSKSEFISSYKDYIKDIL